MTNEEWMSMGYLSVDELNASYRDTRKKLKKVLEDRPGRRPGNMRGVERSYVALMDPVKMQSFVRNTNAGSPANITDDQRTALKNVLCLLSEQEQNCYIMAHGYGYSYQYIADLLGISKGTVTTYIKRAQDKVSSEVKKEMYAVI